MEIERFIPSKKVFYSVYPKPFGFPPTRATHAYIGYESYSLLRRAHFILQRVQILPIFDSILIYGERLTKKKKKSKRKKSPIEKIKLIKKCLYNLIDMILTALQNVTHIII